jgi:hypothetical protein
VTLFSVYAQPLRSTPELGTGSREPGAGKREPEPVAGGGAGVLRETFFRTQCLGSRFEPLLIQRTSVP